jgi:hypothetical protein
MATKLTSEQSSMSLADAPGGVVIYEFADPRYPRFRFGRKMGKRGSTTTITWN